MLPIMHARALFVLAGTCLTRASKMQAKGQEAMLGSLSKNVGTAIGLELRDSTQQLSASNSKPVQAGMTFNVAVGGQAASCACMPPCWEHHVCQCSESAPGCACAMMQVFRD